MIIFVYHFELPNYLLPFSLNYSRLELKCVPVFWASMAKSPVLLSPRPGRRPLFQPGEDDGGTAGDQSITPASKRLKGR